MPKTNRLKPKPKPKQSTKEINLTTKILFLT